MPTIRNPINQNTYIDLTESLENIPFSYGRYADSGLFSEQGIASNATMFKVLEQKDTKMTKLTSRTERDAMAVDKAKEKLITMAGITIKETGGVHVEDLQGISNDLFTMESETWQDATLKELTRLGNAASANYEYLITTASQGKVLDPLDGAVAMDLFAMTGTTQSTFTLDASPTSDIFSEMNRLANQVSELNGSNGNVGTIEVVLGETAFTAIVSHPDFSGLAQLAFSGMGQAAMNNPLINRTAGVQERTMYGYRREFMWNNFLFVTYPQKFRRWNGTQVDAVAATKGWTIVHDVSGLYEVKFCPAPYASQLRGVGQKWLARTTGIVNDTHSDITIESHMIPYMKRPEMAIDITVTTA